MDIQSLISITIGVINLVLGIFVFLKNKKSISNRIFLFVVLSIGLWILGLALINKNLIILISDFIPTLGLRMAFFGASLLAFFFALLSLEFPKRDLVLPKLIRIFGFLIACFFILISIFTNWIVKEVHFYNSEFTANYGFLYKGFGIYYSLFMVGGLINLFRKYRKSKGEEKNQVGYFFLGSSISIIIGSATNLIYPLLTGLSTYSKFGPISTIFLVLFTTLAITRYHLFGIKVILTELLVGVTALILLIQTILAETLWLKVLGFGLLSLFSIVGYFLIQSVMKEIALREELEKAYLELEKLDKAKSEFISIASHQLRTPLTAIKGYISLIREKTYGVAPGKMKRPLKNIYISTERLIKLVNDLLNISRIEAGKIELKLEKLSLEEVISTVVEELKPIAQEKSIYLKWEKDKEPLSEISLDREKIRQVILNIVDNGIRYTYAGGVMIRCQKTDGKYLVSITDTGEGLTKNEISSLFKTFTRGSAGQRLWTEGVGLGLYIAKKFLELHNGKIWVESSGKGQGSTFYIEIPIK